MNRIVKIAVLIGALAVGSAQAAESKSFSRAYGLAGCGLGSIIMGKHGGQVFASTSNGFGYNQSFAISSGTSNCADSGMNEVAQRVDRFIVVNKVALAGDIARGNGETLGSLSSLFSCKNDAALASKLQGSFSTIFPSYEIEANIVTDNIITVIMQDAELSASCDIVG